MNKSIFLIVLISIATPLFASASTHSNNTTTTLKVSQKVMQKEGAMEYVEIYTNTTDQKSYFREVKVKTSENQHLGGYSALIPSKGLMFRYSEQGQQFPQHTAPQQQFIIYRSGEVRVTASGGESRLFKAGDVLLASDTQGEGHSTEIVASGEAIIIPLT